MLTINTNLSSLIAQNSLKSSTNKLNQAIERMSTGYKINHSKDNAANYSIVTNMNSKISSYMVAEDNCSMGLDMLTTATENLDLIYDKLTRLRDLAEQSSNGTYGEQSLKAINSEANALVDEINRIYSTAEYNGLKLFGTSETQQAEPALASEPIATFGMARATSFDGLERVSEADTIEANQSYRIDDYTDLKALQDFVNGGGDTTNVTFELTSDIDMEGKEFRGIGYNYQFKGTFNGNGYVIRNLTIEVEENYVGLFGYVLGATIDSLGVENCTISGQRSVGGLVGSADGLSITNSYATGSVTGSGRYVGGLVGYANNTSITNSYATGNVTGSDNYVGGLIGYTNSTTSITNSYATGSVDGDMYVGGLAGTVVNNSSITTSYATGSVTSSSGYVGGLAGSITNNSSITNSYATGSVTGSGNYIGGLLGYSSGATISGSYYNQDGCSKGVGSGSATGVEAKTVDEILAICTPESMGYTEDAGWTIVNGTPLLSWQKEAQNLGGTGGTGGATGGGTTGGTPGGSYAPGSIVLQIGADNSWSSQIGVDLSFVLDGIEDLRGIGVDNNDYLTKVDNLLLSLNDKQTQYGAAQNRLESALTEIEVQYSNLISSRSTLRDADIAEVSSQYIQQQILQQASATLLSTANQTPSIALQLI